MTNHKKQNKKTTKVVTLAKDLAHYAAGFTCSILAQTHPVLSYQLLFMFIAYQALEEYEKKDHSHRDVLEFAVGWIIGFVVSLLA